jgi:potassium/chloride transporter 9
MTDPGGVQARRRAPLRSHSNFAVRSARDEAGELDRRFSQQPSPAPNEETPLLSLAGQLAQLDTNVSRNGRPQGNTPERDHGIDSMRDWFSRAIFNPRSKSPKQTQGTSPGQEQKRLTTDAIKPRPGAFPRPVGGTSKLGTFAGVFVPTTLNVLSILMFLRFGFILGQTGVVGMMGKFI